MYFGQIWSPELEENPSYLEFYVFMITTPRFYVKIGVAKKALKTMKATLTESLMVHSLNYHYLWGKKTISYFVPLPDHFDLQARGLI